VEGGDRDGKNKREIKNPYQLVRIREQARYGKGETGGGTAVTKTGVKRIPPRRKEKTVHQKRNRGKRVQLIYHPGK